jgi:hypothetical protein
MGVTFFGQFLIERGEIDSQQLCQALDLMESENRSLGELAIEAGFADESDCRRVNGEQRRLDKPFGELAQQMGILNSVELEELLQLQQQSRLQVSDAMLRLGHIPIDRLAALEDVYKRDQACFQGGDSRLPGPLSGNRLARCLVDMLPRYFLRLARIDSQIDRGCELEDLDSELKMAASLTLVGSPGVDMCLTTGHSFARRVASGISGLPDSVLSPELCIDALGEFLNVMAGNAMMSLQSEGLEYRLEAPRYDETPRYGWMFYVASDRGAACFILNES